MYIYIRIVLWYSFTMYLTNKEINLLLRAIGEYEEAVVNMPDYQVEDQRKTFNYSEVAMEKITFKLMRQQQRRKQND